MDTKEIGKLERIALRQVWTHEAYDFTKWLQENIDVLNISLGLTLVNVEREQSAGDFNIDLVAEDEAGRKFIIENQLEKSNHDHLEQFSLKEAHSLLRRRSWRIRLG